MEKKYLGLCGFVMLKFELFGESEVFGQTVIIESSVLLSFFSSAFMLISLNPLKHSVHKANCLPAPYTTLQTCPVPSIATALLISLKG